MNTQKCTLHRLSLDQLPVDLFADPDGSWTYESLIAAAGFTLDVEPPPVIAALAAPWGGHPDGSAVVAGAVDGDDWIAVIECEEARSSHAA